MNNMTTDRCFDCGGLWKRSEHEPWCPHWRPPIEETPQGCSNPPDALAIEGPGRKFTEGPLAMTWYDHRFWLREEH